ncbi:protein DELAY OF GERMINATION 1 [Sesamum alatum]|uniref:Protein DELAY OF GERMINATION 1 n=1 Tax=Sesamum alatum TaxID=300844 RepID=A0AAE1XRC4_9LAMI|nr:protein DELAY OF GERMINATION 1 [Sesamum alatum]
MSDLPNSVTYMTQAIRNGLHERESFHKFFECWIVEQDQHLQELISASKEYEEQRERGRGREDVQDTTLRLLLERVIQHYEHYYRAKARWAKSDVLSMFNPSWRSSLEDAFLWIGGWRPSMTFHLLYSKSGLQLEARLAELIQGLSTGDLGDLSPGQLDQVNELQKQTIREEKEITEKLAKQQETVADSSMVELTHVVTEMMREGQVDQAMDTQRVDETLAPKEEGLVEVLQRADGLRLKTLKAVLNILSPVQGAYFLIAAAELHLRVHEWGKKRDARRNEHSEAGHGQQH